MKLALISIVFSLLGILFVVWINYQTLVLHHSLMKEMEGSGELYPVIVSTRKIYKLIPVGIGLIGLVFGTLSVKDKTWIGIIGIVFSVILIVLAFIPLWTYLIPK